MRKTKLEKGITLIALIITIVVLLILAVVSIGAIKNSKIITHSQNASNEYVIAEEKEQLQLALTEWQLQKNTQGNTKTFKATIEEALIGKGAEVGQDDSENGPLTVTFSKTGNKYKVTKDGEISKIVKLEGTALEKYIFGQELGGRIITEILNTKGSIAFKDDEQTEEDETQTIGAVYLTMNQEDDLFLYFKVQNIIYKFAVDESTYKTNAEYGIVKVYNPSEESKDSKIGKTVSYDKKTWTIMYDDDTNGLQMICNETYQYNSENFCLGYDDSLITNWDSLNTGEDEEFRLEDLNKNGKLDDDSEKAIYSYNNAITTLNTACENLFKDESGNYKNSNITDVRCVGSNPNKGSKNSENATTYTSENLKKLPEDDSAGIADNKCKSTDLNYVTDFNRMLALGIIQSDNDYWLASRMVDDRTSGVTFYMRLGYTSGDCGGVNILDVQGSRIFGNNTDYSIRPVIKLESSASLTESGSSTDYVLN